MQSILLVELLSTLHIVMLLREISFEVCTSLPFNHRSISFSFRFDLVYHMKETGWEKIEEKDTNDYMYQYREEKTMNF